MCWSVASFPLMVSANLNHGALEIEPDLWSSSQTQATQSGDTVHDSPALVRSEYWTARCLRVAMSRRSLRPPIIRLLIALRSVASTRV